MKTYQDLHNQKFEVKQNVSRLYDLAARAKENGNEAEYELLCEAASLLSCAACILRDEKVREFVNRRQRYPGTTDTAGNTIIQLGKYQPIKANTNTRTTNK